MALRPRKPAATPASAPAAPPLVLDPTLGDPVARAILVATAQRDIDGMVRTLHSVTDQTHLDFVLSVMTQDAPGLAAALTNWMRQHPGDDVRVRAALGAAMVAEAWVIRSAKRAEQVSPEQFEQFWAGLRGAERVLTDLVREHPGTGTAWRWLLDVARGLQWSKEELAQLFGRCEQAVPLYLPACRSYLQGICAKWGGSTEQSLEFARWVSSRSPDGHFGPFLVAEAHFEHSVESMEEARTPEAVAEVRAALDRTRLATVEWGNDPMGLAAKNVFAITARRLNDHEVGKHMVQLIGYRADRVTASPWNYFGNAGAVYANTGRFYGLW